MRIAFLDQTNLAYDTRTPLNEPLGGTQSAVAYLSAELARLGGDITVINGVPAPITTDGVRFLKLTEVTGDLLNRFDVVVVITVACGGYLRRDCGVMVPLVLWAPLTTDDPVVEALAKADERKMWNGFVMVSNWQAETYVKAFGIDPQRIRILRNAISPAFHDLPETDKWHNPKQEIVLAYTSMPYRGLDVLLTSYPLIKKNIPEARLKVYSGLATYQSANSDDQFSPLYELCRALPGAEYLGPVSQAKLAQAMANADVLAYPSTFAETACIAAMEAMASGMLVVTINYGALEETLAGFGFLLERGTDRFAMFRNYADLVVKVITEARANPQATADRLRAQRAYAMENYTWPKRAREWWDWLTIVKGDRPG